MSSPSVASKIARTVSVRRFYPKPKSQPQGFQCNANRRAKQARRSNRKPKLQKQIIFSDVRNILEDNKMVTAFHYNDGITSTEWEELRFAMRQKGICVKIVPNKITQKSLEDTVFANMQPLFVSSTGIFFSPASDTVSDMITILRKYPKIELLGGKLEDRLVANTELVKYSKLPSIDILRGQLCQLLMHSASRVSSLLSSNQQRLSSLLAQHIKDHEGQSN